MEYSTLESAILLCRSSGVTPFTWGHRGIGKSSLHEQIAFKNKMGFIDCRLSQLEASDLRGLPGREDGKTVFLPPADMPHGGRTWDEVMEECGKHPEDRKRGEWIRSQPSLNEGILFLDELNRAQDDVLQAAFELVLDRRIGQYVLPDGWSVCAAGNFNDGYITNGFDDSAFIDRFCHLTLSTGSSSFDEWCQYVASRHGEEAGSIIEFVSSNMKMLDGDPQGSRDVQIMPSRRSWESVIHVEREYSNNPDKYTKEARHQVLAGLLGQEVAMSYSHFDTPVKPLDLLNKGVEAMRDKLMEMSRAQLTGLTWSFATMVKDKDEEALKTAVDYCEYLVSAENQDKDIAVAFIQLMVGNGKQGNVQTALFHNAKLRNLFDKYREEGKGESFYSIAKERPKLLKILKDVHWGNPTEDLAESDESDSDSE